MVHVLLGIFSLATMSTPVQVDGYGYMRFAREGEVVYAKQVELTVFEGKIVSAEHLPVLPIIEVEGKPDRLTVSLQGEITATFGSSSKVVGRLVLADFPQDVRPVESNGYLKVFGKAKLGDPGDGLFGVIRKWVPKQKTEETPAIKVYDANGEPITFDIKEVHKEETLTIEPPTAEFLQSGGVQINIKENVVLQEGNIYLGEIATVFAKADISPKIAGLSISTVPPLGVERHIDRTLILGKLRLIGIDIAKVKIVGPTEITVTQEGQSISQTEFVAAAIAAVSKQFGEVEQEFEQPEPDLVAPLGTKQLVVERIYQTGKAISATVVAYVNKKRINSRTIRLVSKEVPITLNRGDAVTVVIISNDVRVEVSAKVKQIDRATGVVTVETETGAELSGRYTSKGIVEVRA